METLALGNTLPYTRLSYFNYTIELTSLHMFRFYLNFCYDTFLVVFTN